MSVMVCVMVHVCGVCMQEFVWLCLCVRESVCERERLCGVCVCVRECVLITVCVCLCVCDGVSSGTCMWYVHVRVCVVVSV